MFLLILAGTLKTGQSNPDFTFHNVSINTWNTNEGFRTAISALHDAGIEAPYELDVPKEDETKLLRRSIAFLPAEEENTWKSSPGLLVMMQ